MSIQLFDWSNKSPLIENTTKSLLISSSPFRAHNITLLFIDLSSHAILEFLSYFSCLDNNWFTEYAPPERVFTCCTDFLHCCIE